MELDLQLFRDFELKKIKPTLRTYSWQPPCISLGYAQKIKDEIDVAKAEALGWDVVKRPTGGGIVFHNTAEVTYSLVMAIDDPVLPKGLVPSYRKISEAIVMALKELGVDAEIRNTKYETLNKSEIRNSKVLNQLCFSYPAEYEVVVDGKKIVGSAQKRGRVALLQQGSIFVRATPEEHLKVLKKPHAELNAISLEEVLGRQVEHAEVAAALVKGFSSLF
ncbi:MAG TPA: lipoate--protein ligase family protein [Candidatus Sulfotelmatobacter sp.]|nr:lipoate--protein ligase family protein [Candidatus Sulfotelmatobacter sp.]